MGVSDQRAIHDRPQNRSSTLGTLAVTALVLVGAILLNPPKLASGDPAGGTRSVYSNSTNWLCLPGARTNYCKTNLNVTVVNANGGTRVERFRPAVHPKFDCFYVYPTAATDAGPNQPLKVEPSIVKVTQDQFARFGSDCRLFAPLYRQATITGLTKDEAASTKLAVESVTMAWDYYVSHYNHGRGVVLIGHSQGSGMLYSLMQNVIEHDPAQRKLVISAIIPGTPVGPHSFTSFSRCRSATQTGCIVNWDAYWSNQPPGAASAFGHVLFGTQPAQCVNPADLSGGTTPLQSIFSTVDTHAFNDPSRDSSIRTPWIELPGIVNGQCVVEHGYGFFAVTSKTEPTDDRVQDLDLLSLPSIGLHESDIDLVMGDLIRLVRQQGASYVHAHTH
jgi:Protein of unknown function (DUF3089)